MYRFFSKINWNIRFKRIKIFAFYGKSGTGKSHHALKVADLYDIETFIDDGLLIHRGSIIAGISAKKAPTQIEAVRRAIFYDNDHQTAVIHAIQKVNPVKILIIGTSKRMIYKIVKRLSLTSPQTYIHIDEIAGKEEQEKALRARSLENKHVIPVPTIEVERKFPGQLVDSIELFLTRKLPTRRVEKSVVRPYFNTLGKLFISKQVINACISHELKKHYHRMHLQQLKITYSTRQLRYGITLIIRLSADYGINLVQTCSDIQIYLKNRIEYLTGLEVHNLAINIVALEEK